MNHIPRCISKIHKSIIPKYAYGSYIIDTKNRKYLDLTSGIGALSLGHNNYEINNYVKEQMNHIIHCPQQVFGANLQQLKLNRILYSTMPSPNLSQFFYTNSGSEATDNAIKLARHATKKTNIITMKRGFHGRTLGALSLNSSNTTSKNGCQPLMPGVFFCNSDNIDDLNDIFNLYTNPNETAAFVFESIQGEGGINNISSSFLKYARELCNEYNIIMIADEIQCGSMRTGYFWDITRKNIIPDIITFGKGIANGYPIAGLATTKNIINKLPIGMLGGTYGGNALVCSAAYQTIKILRKNTYHLKINEKSKYILDKLMDDPFIKKINIYGLMIGIEFTNEYMVHILTNKLRDNGVLVLTAGNNNQIMRILPPLNISYNEINEFLDKLNYVINQTIYCK